jgi:hypothetical protein
MVRMAPFGNGNKSNPDAPCERLIARGERVGAARSSRYRCRGQLLRRISLLSLDMDSITKNQVENNHQDLRGKEAVEKLRALVKQAATVSSVP